MKFLQFYRDGRPTLGVITEKGVVDMSAHPELPQTMLALCQSGDTAALAAIPPRSRRWTGRIWTRNL